MPLQYYAQHLELSDKSGYRARVAFILVLLNISELHDIGRRITTDNDFEPFRDTSINDQSVFHIFHNVHLYLALRSINLQKN